MFDPNPKLSDIIEQKSDIGAIPKHARRLSDKILIAFHHACDDKERDAAKLLLGILETCISRKPHPTDIRRFRLERERFIAAHQRLWHLWHDAEADT